MTPAGSAGDVHPFLGLGRALRERGHEVVVLTSEPFRAEAVAAGLEFESVLDAARFEAVLDDPDLWHPRRGPRAIFRLLRREDLERVYAKLEQHYAPGRTVLVGHPLSFSTRVFEEVRSAPAVTIQLAPIAFRTRHLQPVLPAGIDLNRWPSWARRLFWWAADRFVVDRLAARDLHPFMRARGLTPGRVSLQDWIQSPTRVLGFFPEWFGPPQPDWPTQARLVGFPLYDGSPYPSLGTELDRYLEASPRPVVVTPGSANRQAPELFQAAAVATERRGIPAIFVTPWADQLPRSLPGHVRHVERAPFSALFPRAALVVHHGGIGTTAQALAAGVPQIVQGRCFDQPDNGARIERLGVGRSLAGRPPDALALERALNALLDDPAVGRAAERWAGEMETAAGRPAMERAADLVERTAGPDFVSAGRSRAR